MRSPECQGPHNWGQPDGGVQICMNCGQVLPLEVEAPLNSVAIQRIIDEVRLEKYDGPSGYNRVYHRHNR